MRDQSFASRLPHSASLVVQSAFLGDMILTTPLIAELARRGPVDIVATPASAPLLANNPDVRDVIVFDKRGSARGVRGLWRTMQRLRWRGDDGDRRPRAIAAAYLAQGSVRSAALVASAGVRERVGFHSAAGRALLTRRVPFVEGMHHAERLLRLAIADDAPLDAPRLRPRLYPGLAERAAVDALLGSGDATPIVALAPGSVWATKRWPYFAELARALAPDARIALVGSPDDAEITGAIARALPPERVIDATGRLSLLASAELIGRAAVLVTNDSAPLHLGSAMATPTVAIFGPTVPAFGFGPLAPRRAVAGHDALDCRPCDRHGPRRCPLGHWRCMRELTSPAIERLVRELLDSHSPLP